MVCSYPRSMNRWNAAATRASRMGGLAPAAEAFSPRPGAALLELMEGNVAPATGVKAPGAVAGGN
nr:hypothetical protein StreXyl84_04570 [Streptomyces sp. Xyl84]